MRVFRLLLPVIASTVSLQKKSQNLGSVKVNLTLNFGKVNMVQNLDYVDILV